MHKVDICGKPKSNKLLCKFLCRQVTLLCRIPCFENLLSEIHVFELLKHLYSCSLALQDPFFYVLAPKQICITQSKKSLLVALSIDVPHDFYL